jgi:predicted anti-sigma-YlaC factor YlaD
MKDCIKVQRLLSGYLDNETNSEDTSLVAGHLVICAQCQKELAELSRVKADILELIRKPLPQDYLVSRLRDDLADERRMKERFSLAGLGNLSRRLIPVPVTVIALSIALLILSPGQYSNKSSLDEHILSGNSATQETVLGLMLGMVN